MSQIGNYVKRNADKRTSGQVDMRTGGQAKRTSHVSRVTRHEFSFIFVKNPVYASSA